MAMRATAFITRSVVLFRWIRDEVRIPVVDAGAFLPECRIETLGYGGFEAPSFESHHIPFVAVTCTLARSARFLVPIIVAVAASLIIGADETSDRRAGPTADQTRRIGLEGITHFHANKA